MKTDGSRLAGGLRLLFFAEAGDCFSCLTPQKLEAAAILSVMPSADGAQGRERQATGRGLETTHPGFLRRQRDLQHLNAIAVQLGDFRRDLRVSRKTKRTILMLEHRLRLPRPGGF
jgi:hypothetical protein